ncbi:MAG TPA: aldehyde dehydrogenase [Candidatus Acidoferrales bacterium]|nr:aldehyde dehydrogenase [Candidatus Acidoferrales bacterium]
MNTCLLRIGGKARPAANGATFERRNPVSDEVATSAAAATIEDAAAAVEAASSAFPAWSALGPNQRRMLLLKAADRLEARTGDFIERIGAETGGTAPWAGFNAMLAAGMLREAASLTTQVTGEVIPSDTPGSYAFSVRQPAGVVLGIAPWNAPVILGVRAIATPLACGNTVVLKASEVCPATHSLIIEVLEEAGLPAGSVNLITNAPAAAPAIVESLIAHPAVRRVNFTGSTKVGKIVSEIAGRHLKPVLLELGGKAPLVVLDDADLDAAVNAAAFGAFANQGQICMSTERIVIDQKIADAFIAKLKAKAAALPAGAEGNVVLGPMVSQAAAVHIEDLAQNAEEKGANVVLAPKITQRAVVSAAVIDRVTPAMRLYSEESFGPIVAMVRVNGDEEAIRVANDTEYGLSAAVFSQNITRALNVATRINSGICHINGSTVADEAQMPFGGVKASGYGRFGGKAGVAEFTDLRWITIETNPHYPF